MGEWGSWSFSALQKAAEDISQNAMAAAKGAAKGMADLQLTLAESLGHKPQDAAPDESPRPRDALDRLEAVGPDSSIGRGLKALDSSMDSLVSEAYQTLGNAWKGGVDLIHRLESSAEQLAGTVHNEGFTALAPNLIQSGKDLTSKSIKALEYVGKETLDILALDDLDHQAGHGGEVGDAATFDHCFYIYGGPEHIEELEALCTHYTLVCNRARSKLSKEERASFDELCTLVFRALALGNDGDCSPGSNRGKQIESESLTEGNEMKSLRDASVSKAAEMATSFTATLGGLAASEVMQRTCARIEAIKAEGVHRLSEICAVCLSHLVLLGKSLLRGKSGDGTAKESVESEWPDDCLRKAYVIRSRASIMATDLQAISDSFVTGIGDVVAAFQAAKEEVAATPAGDKSVERMAQVLRSDLDNDASAAVEKLQHGLEQLVYVLLSTSVKG